MKPNLKLFIIAVISFLPISRFLYSQVKIDTTYFPLAIGHQWVYKSSVAGSFDTASVVDTQRVNGRLYYGIASYASPLAYWLRSDNNKVFIAPSLVIQPDTTDIKEAMVYDFNAQLNAAWTVNLPFSNSALRCDFNGQYTLINKHRSIPTPVGLYTDCIQFMHSPSCIDAGRSFEWFALGVGRVRYCQENIWGEDTFNLVKTNLPTSVSFPTKSQTEITYRLPPNFPNPFNPSTTITFELPEKSYVEVTVYDELGRKIETLVDSYEERGSHSIVWDATNNTSGIYFCRIHTKTFNQTIKLVLVQ